MLSGCKEKAECTFCAQHITEWVGVIIPEGTSHLRNVTHHVDRFDFSLVASSTLHLLPQHTIGNRIAATNTESEQPQWMPLTLYEEAAVVSASANHSSHLSLVKLSPLAGGKWGHCFRLLS